MKIISKRKIIYFILFVSLLIEAFLYIIADKKPAFTGLGYALVAILGFIVTSVSYVLTIVITYLVDKNAFNKRH